MATRPMHRLSHKKIYCVYVLLDTRKSGYFRYGRWVFHNEPFYVGKGTEARANSHLKDKQNPFKTRVINKILKAGLEPIVLIKRTCNYLTEKQALDLEMSMIPRIGRRNLGFGPLTNLTDGGEGHSGHLPSNKTRKKLSEALIERHANMSTSKKKAIYKKISESNSGRVYTKEHRDNISKGKTNPSKETRRLISEAVKARVISKETRRRLRESGIKAWAKKHREMKEAKRAA